MRYTSGLGSKTVVNSFTSTLPPARIQAVNVGVDVAGCSVWVAVGAGVALMGLLVVMGIRPSESWLVVVTIIVELASGVVNLGEVTWVDVPPEGGNTTIPQACNSPSNTQAIVQHLRTDAVYHKNLRGIGRLNPCE